MEVATPSGSRYYVVFKDDFSGWKAVNILKQKSDVADSFINFAALLETETGRRVKTLRSDNGGEYRGGDFLDWLLKSGIRHETSAPHTPQQNRVAERSNRTIMEATRSQLHTKGVPQKLWGEAVSCATHVLNRTLSSTNLVTPYEAWFGKKPDVSYFKVFGSRAFAHIPDANRRKLDPKAQECIFVGYCRGSKAYRLWNPATQKIVISRNVIIDESTSCDLPLHTTQSILVKQRSPRQPVTQPERFVPSEENTSSPKTIPEATSPVVVSEQPTESSNNDIQVITEQFIQLNDQPAQPTDQQPEQSTVVPLTIEQPASSSRRRSSRTPIYTEKYKQYKGMYSSTSQNQPEPISHLMIEPFEPRSYQEAISSPDAELWKVAIQEEYDSLTQNQTWVLTTLPPGRTAIKNRLVFKVKPGYKEVVERYKARLVAKGYTQRYGLDYQDTYAPVVKHSALRVALAIVAALDLEMIQLDIKTAFLYGSLEEELYMDQPEGFVKRGHEHEVCRLVKSIYGLKQASRVWNAKFNEFLLKFCLTRCTADPCVYYRHQGEEVTIVVIYVDDGLVCSSKREVLFSILEHLSNTFEIRSLPAD